MKLLEIISFSLCMFKRLGHFNFVLIGYENLAKKYIDVDHIWMLIFSFVDSYK